MLWSIWQYGTKVHFLLSCQICIGFPTRRSTQIGASQAGHCITKCAISLKDFELEYLSASSSRWWALKIPWCNLGRAGELSPTPWTYYNSTSGSRWEGNDESPSVILAIWDHCSSTLWAEHRKGEVLDKQANKLMFYNCCCCLLFVLNGFFF